MSTSEEVSMEFVRMVHIFSGILWIGLLYYYNFVQAIALPKMDASARPHYQTTILPFSLNVFRWAALSTLVFGLIYIAMAGVWIDDYYDSDRFTTILIGAVIGTIMAANVWFIIYPKQGKIIAAIADKLANNTDAPADQPKWARTALLASRTNTMLSIPLLFFMVAAPHLPSLWEPF